KQPIAQLVINRAFAKSALLQPCRNFSNRFARVEPIDDRRIDRDAVADKPNWIFVARRLNNLSNWQMELPRELEIAFVVRRHRLNGPRSITKQDVIGDPDWDFLLVCRIDCKRARENAGFFFCELGALEITFARGALPVFAHGRPLILSYDLIDERMFRREHHISRAVKSIGSRREHANPRVVLIDLEFDLGAFAAANPIALKQFDSFRPIESLELVDQTLGVRGDP